MFKKGFFIVIFLIFITSCKSSKISNTGIANFSAKKVIKKHYAVAFDKNSIKADLMLKYKGKADIPKLNASLRIVKDSIIWISVSKFGFPLAKLMITQNEVKYYEKLSKTYFIGDFELIQNWLGVEFDFNQIQNLFLGEALLDLNNGKYQIDIQENLYTLKHINNSYPFDILFWVNPKTFKLKKEKITDSKKEQVLTILYKDFEKINESLFPKGFTISAIDKKDKTIIDINYRNIIFNTALRFPFKVPNGYKEIKFNDSK
ncbi:MAG: DUF4292 domain-containing protein [Flavobacteriaceae bacterium]|nr:DUF4292 domain-containing protein [Flavobacteriaceae bacterium]